MVKILQTVLRGVAASPRYRTVLSIFLAISTGLVSGALINEITINNKVEWLAALRSINMYILLALAAMNYIYYAAIHKIELDILRFSDGVFCMAYVRSSLLPDAVEAAKEKIRNGDTADFEAAMASFEKVLR